jgi:flagellar protein FliL
MNASRKSKSGIRMTDASLQIESQEQGKPKSGGRKLLLISAAAALLLAGGGFYGAYSGLLDPAGLSGKKEAGHGKETEAETALRSIAFVPLDPIMVSLPKTASARHLRFTGTLEVTPGKAEAVGLLMPRIQDVINTYLRAVDVADIEDPAASARLRAQMLRRIQVVTGDGAVRDLLVTEFVLN